MITQLKKIRRALPGLWRRLRQRGSVAHAQNQAREVLAHARQFRGAIEAGKLDLQAEYADTYERWTSQRPEHSRPQPFHYHSISARMITVGAWALLVFECLFAAWIMPIVTTLPDWLAVLAGVVIAIMLAFAAKGTAMILVASDAETPVAARDRLVRWVVLCGVVEILLLAVLFFVRSAAGELAVRLAWTFGPASGLISLVTPILSGMLAAVAELFTWSTNLTQAWDEADAVDAELVLLEDAARRALSGDDPPRWGAAPAQRTALLGPGGAGPGAVATGLLLSLLLCDAAEAQGIVYTDWTVSSVAAERNDALREVVRVTPQVSRQHSIQTWMVVPFTDDAFTVMPRSVVRWPLAATVRCPAAAQGEAEVLIEALRRRRVQEAEAECARLRRLASANQGEAEARALREMQSALFTPPARQGSCSSVIDLLHRLSGTRRGTVAIAISDGLETCGSPWNRIPAPAAGATTLLVLVTPSDLNGRNRAGSFQARRTTIQRIAPWLEVVPSWRLGEVLLATPRR